MGTTKKKKGVRADGRVQIHRSRGLDKATVFYGRTKAEAEQKYQQAVLDRALAKSGATQERYTFREVSEAYEGYIEKVNRGSPVRRGTVNAYKKRIHPAQRYFGDTAMDDIDTQAIYIYLETMKAAGYSKHTVKNAKSVLSCVFTYWCTNYHGFRNPVQLSKLPSGLKEGGREEPTEEQRDIINAHPEGCGFWAWLFEYTGMRMGEANGLRWKDVDLSAGTITLTQAMPWDRNQPYREDLKTEKAYRTIPILTPLRPMLALRKASHAPEDYVLSGTDVPLTESKYAHRWMLYCRDLGLCETCTRETKIPATSTRPERIVKRVVYKPVVTAHQFRHLFATNLFYAGIPDMVAQHLLGHADITTTRRVYQHIREKENQRFTAQLDAYVTSKSSEAAEL